MLRMAVMVVFALNAVMLAAILIAKPIHRRRQDKHERRRAAYIGVLSRYLAAQDHRVNMGKKVAEDRAFLDAMIDMRSIVTGSEADALGDLVDRYDIARRQTLNLESRRRTDRRLSAAVALAELADESAAPVLVRHLGDREQEIRVQCARGLGRMRWKPGIEAILDRLEIETPWVRSRFADTLIDFGNSATWPLIAYVRSNHRLGVSGVPTAVRTLGAIGDVQAVQPLLDVLDAATDAEVQIALVEALGQLAATGAFDPVEKAARSEDWRLRAKAATALGRLGDESVVPTLALGLEDENWWVRRNSASALTRFPSGIDVLYRTLNSDDGFARDAASEALAEAGEVLAARDRIDGGIASTRDFELIEHVEGPWVVTA